MSNESTSHRMSSHLEAAVAFLCSIGLTVRIEPGATGFLKGIRIEKGVLLIDPKAKVSEVLHEAGHIALLPPEFRAKVCDNVDDAVKAMFEACRAMLDANPDSELARALVQSGESEATAWAWAAGKAIGLPDKLIIADADYNGDGRMERVRLATNAHFGINGLQHGAWCAVRDNVVARARGLPVYPKLARWLQHAVTTEAIT